MKGQREGKAWPETRGDRGSYAVKNQKRCKDRLCSYVGRRVKPNFVTRKRQRGGAYVKKIWGEGEKNGQEHGKKQLHSAADHRVRGRAMEGKRNGGCRKSSRQSHPMKSGNSHVG